MKIIQINDILVYNSIYMNLRRIWYIWNVINLLKRPNRRGDLVITLKTNQIRKFLTAVNVVRNKVDLYKAKNKGAESLSKELTAEIKFLKVNLRLCRYCSDKISIFKISKAGEWCVFVIYCLNFSKLCESWIFFMRDFFIFF